jgi:surfactin synthase thioesterase subunit/acyl carrier protein
MDTDGHTIFVEMSPHPILTPSVEENLREANAEGVALASTRRAQDERQTMLSSLGALFVRGVPVAWKAFFPDSGRVVELPTYAWQKQRYWFDETPAESILPQQKPIAWQNVPAEERAAWVTHFVHDQVAKVVRMPPDQLDDSTPIKLLGIDSLMALELRRNLETAFFIKLEATLAWQVDDVRGLTQRLLEMLDVPENGAVATSVVQAPPMVRPISMDSAAWIHRPLPNPQNRIRLFCLAYAGVGASRFRQWAQLLPSWIEVCPIQLPGREERLREPAFDTMEPLVDALVQVIESDLDRPFAFFGCSVGGLVAFELSRAIRARLGTSPRHLFIAACASPDRVNPMQRELSTLLAAETAGPEVITTLRNLGLLGASVIADVDLLRAVWPTLRADVCLALDYRYRRDEVLDVPISVFGGAEDRGVTRAELVGWSALTSARFGLSTVPGGHLFMDTSPEKLVEGIEQTLRNDEMFVEKKRS